MLWVHEISIYEFEKSRKQIRFERLERKKNYVFLVLVMSISVHFNWEPPPPPPPPPGGVETGGPG